MSHSGIICLQGLVREEQAQPLGIQDSQIPEGASSSCFTPYTQIPDLCQKQVICQGTFSLNLHASCWRQGLAGFQSQTPHALSPETPFLCTQSVQGIFYLLLTHPDFKPGHLEQTEERGAKILLVSQSKELKRKGGGAWVGGAGLRDLRRVWPGAQAPG